MSTIYIPYALGNLGSFSFKEITKKEYDIFLGALAEQDRILKAYTTARKDAERQLAERAHSLSRYSEDDMAATSSSTEKSYDKLYSEAYKNIAKKWATGLQTQQQLLYPTRGYHLLIENLQINTSGVLVEIIGNGIQLLPSRQHQQIRQSLLNQTVQIIR